jgi:antitoxin (DNA-binding transcriptional repressor) of toxin-antitoxin stability system
MQVSMREFKAHLSSYLSQAQEGQLIDVTSHRKVVARIVGVPAHGSEGVARLAVGGVAQWGGGKPAGAAYQLSRAGHNMSEMVLEDRG